MRTRTSGLVLAGVVGLTGLAVGGVVGPVAASAAGGSAQAVTHRVTAIKNALAGLVKDGTLSQAQADKVATTLDNTLPKRDGFGRPGFGRGLGRRIELDAAAGVIGVTADDLRAQLRSGKTLAQVAQGKGITQATLVGKLVAAAKTRIAAAVRAGRLTQAQADRMTAGLEARITRLVTSSHPAGAPGRHGDNQPPPATGTSPSATGTF